MVLELVCIRITWRSCIIQISGPRITVAEGLGPRSCFSYKTAHDASTIGLGETRVEGKGLDLTKRARLDGNNCCPW